MPEPRPQLQQRPERQTIRKQFMLLTEWVKTNAAPADDAALGAWLRLHSYSAQRLSGGRLVGAKAWSNDTTQRLCAVKRRTLDAVAAAGLAAWDGEDLVLEGYDHDGEELWRLKSHGGKTGRQMQLAATGYETPRLTPLGQRRGDSPPAQPRGVPEPQPRGDCESDSESESAAAAADRAGEIEPEDPRLVAVVAAGGYLRLEKTGTDLRGEWLVSVAEDTPERVAEVMAYGRRRTQLPVRMPGSYLEHRLAMITAARNAVRAERERTEGDQRKARETGEMSAKAKTAAADAARDRATAGGLLATYDEDTAGWAERLTVAQAQFIADLRAAHDARRPVGLLLLRHLDALPPALVQQATARGRELADLAEGGAA